MAVHVDGLAAVKHVLHTIKTEHLNEAKRDIRSESKRIAERIVIPALKRNAAASDVPIAGRMADTSRARSDRIVFVRVGAVNPKLSGFKRGQGRYKTSMAWGSEHGPVPAATVNTYAVPTGPGYWVLPTVEDRQVVQAAADAYSAMLTRVLRRYQ